MDIFWNLILYVNDYGGYMVHDHDPLSLPLYNHSPYRLHDCTLRHGGHVGGSRNNKIFESDVLISE